MTTCVSVLVVGRVSVDLYARELGASFLEPQTFSKSIGGSPTNVAVAAARLGHRSTLITKVGDDPLGKYVVARLETWGVDTSRITVEKFGLTPVVLAAMDPPEDPQVIFLRSNQSPDTKIRPEELSEQEVNSFDIFWISGGTLAQGSTAVAAAKWLSQRVSGRHTILDLDYRPSFWSSIEDARLAALTAISKCDVVVGNVAECLMAVGTSEPERAADELLSLGVSLAVVKMGAEGVLLASQVERVRIPPRRVDVVCGLGAGDAFGGALIHGLASRWSIKKIGEFANAAGAYVAAQRACADIMPNLAQLTEFTANTI